MICSQRIDRAKARFFCFHRSFESQALGPTSIQNQQPMEEMRNSEGPGEPDELAEVLPGLKNAVTSYASAVREGRAEDAQAAAMKALFLAAEEAQRNPSASMKFTVKAAECERNHDWAGAEAAYRKVLRRQEAAGNPGMIAKARIDLSKLLRLTGKMGEASEFAASATDAARRADMFPVLAMALENEIACALGRQQPEEALAAAREALEVIESDKVFDSMRARALISCAKCLAAMGDAEGAESKLASSWDLLQQPGVCHALPGVNFALDNWWEAKSQILEQKGEMESAQQAISESINRRRKGDSPYAIRLLIGALEKSAALSRRAGAAIQAGHAQVQADALREELRLPN